LLGGPACAGPAAPLPLIPIPVSIEYRSGAFSLGPTTPILVPRADEGAAAAARYLGGLLGRVRGLHPVIRPVASVAAAAAIVFERRTGLAEEGYELEVAPGRVTVAATTDAGLFYGAVTLWQLVPAGHGPVALAALSIHDQPAYRWRGLMLDSARHFQSPEFIRRLIDGMALNKLNVLHWHLTDDQGWRLEIGRYPALTTVGAFRVPAGAAARHDIDAATGKPRLYGAFYRQATVRALVAYASAQHIMIIPEIEMPGHASAAIAAYPELGVAPVHLDAVPADWGVYPHLINADEATCVFFENVLAEVVALFPGPYVHLGGDEVVKTEWQQSPPTRARAQALGLPGTDALHGYLVQRMGRFLAAHGRRLVGWDEILEPGLSTDATILSWRGLDGAITAAKRGNDTVVSPDPGVYLDHRQSGAADEPPGRVIPLSLGDLYRFNPQPPGLDPTEAKHVLGLQADLWTEHVRTDERAGLATFPRAAALAEVGWSPGARRDWDDFLARLGASLGHYRLLGVPFADTEFAVRAGRRYEATGGAVEVTLSTLAGRGEIRYTTDGSEPSPASPRYEAALTLATPLELRANSFAAGAALATSRSYRLDATDARRRSSHALELCTQNVALALEVDGLNTAPRPVVRLDIMNPCWIYRGADLSAPRTLTAAVGEVPFNYQIGADLAKVRVGDARTAAGELEVRIDGCDGVPVAVIPLGAAAERTGVSTLAPATLPVLPGRHELCLRFARPAFDPMWALDWVALDE
jgi:hexosaminidase